MPCFTDVVAGRGPGRGDEASHLLSCTATVLCGLVGMLMGRVSHPCRAHPKYMLERHIGRYQASRRGSASVGLHKGEKIWLRADLVELHTAEQWLTHGRQVCPGC